MTETHEKRTETHACDLIDRQAAIDAICELHIYGKSAIFGEYNENSYAEHLHDAVKVIEELPSAQQWIPCSERLPSKCEGVLVTTSWGTVADGVRVEDIWCINGGVCYVKGEEVVAWMPLPEPWKGET